MQIAQELTELASAARKLALNKNTHVQSEFETIAEYLDEYASVLTRGTVSEDIIGQKMEGLYKESYLNDAWLVPITFVGGVHRDEINTFFDEYEQLMKNIIMVGDTQYEVIRLNKKVSQLLQEYRHDEVLNLSLQAYDVALKHLGEDHKEFLMCLINLATIYKSMGKYTESVTWYQQALHTTRRILGENHLGFGKVLNELADAYWWMGRYTEAESHFLKAKDILRRENHPEFGGTLNNLANLYYAMADYAKAESFYRQAMEFTRRVLGENHPAFASILNNLGWFYLSLGKYAEAETNLLQARDIRHKIQGEDHPDFATSLNNLGGLYQSIGQYDKAESCWHQALNIRRKILGESHPHFAQSLHNLASFYNLVEKYKEAEPLFRQAIEIRRNTLGEDDPDFPKFLGSLALAYQHMFRFEEAEQLCQEAVESSRNIFGENHPDFTEALVNLASVYFLTGEYAKAEALYCQSLEIRRRTLGENHPKFAIFLQFLVRFYAATDRQTEALKMMEQAVSVENQTIGQIFSIASERHRMSYLETIRGNLDVYLSLVYRHPSVSAVRSGSDLVLWRKAITAEASALQHDTVLGDRYPELKPQLKDLTALRMQIAQKTLDGPEREELKSYRKTLAEWNARKDQLEADLARQIPERKLEQQLRAADRQTIAQALPKGTALIEFVRFNVFDFKAVPALGESQWKSARYLAFVLSTATSSTTEPAIQLFDIGEADPIDQTIAAFRASIVEEGEPEESIIPESECENRNIGVVMKPKPSSKDENLSKNMNISAYDNGVALRKALFDPFVHAFRGQKRLIIAPDGDLAKLPFEVLPLDGGRKLIDEYCISYLGTARDILRFGQASTRQSSTPVVIADPDFDLIGEDQHYAQTEHSTFSRHSRELNQACDPFPRLAGTRVEGEQIGDILGVLPWFGGEALEAKLKAYRSPRILHIATHGFFLEDQQPDPNKDMQEFGPMGFKGFAETGVVAGTGLENPLLRSGLALAGANTWLKGGNLPEDAEDGLLTAEDVTGLDLLDTDLVVLSACETGLGEVHVGEGVFGLRRSFVIAGAKTLVMSLWKVPDQQTQELMVDFYQRLLKGEGRAEALRNAQLTLKAKYPHPFYWAAFICQGDPAPLAKGLT